MTARKAAPYFFSLTAPTPCRPAKLVERARPRLRHFDQRPVRKNDIGRLLLRRRYRAAQAFQRREQTERPRRRHRRTARPTVVASSR